MNNMKKEWKMVVENKKEVVQENNEEAEKTRKRREIAEGKKVESEKENLTTNRNIVNEATRGGNDNNPRGTRGWKRWGNGRGGGWNTHLKTPAKNDRYVNYKQADQKIVYFRKNNLCGVWYNAPLEELDKFKKMYIGIVKNTGCTYMLQEWFSMHGLFSIKVTPLGANIALLEEMEEAIIQALIDESEEWVLEKFEDIRKWDPNVVDMERLVWVRCHGIPVHAWNEEFFSSLARKFGTFVGVDENTRKKKSMDVARMLIRTRCYDAFNMVVTANINNSWFDIKVLEEWCGPMHGEGLVPAYDYEKKEDRSDTDSDNSEEDNPGLFHHEDFCSEGSDEGEDEMILEKLKELHKERNDLSAETVVAETVVGEKEGGDGGTEIPEENVGGEEINVVTGNGEINMKENIKEDAAQHQVKGDTVCELNPILVANQSLVGIGQTSDKMKVMGGVEDRSSGVHSAEVGKKKDNEVNGPNEDSLKLQSIIPSQQGVSGGEYDGPILSNSFGPLMRKKKVKSKKRDSSDSCGNGYEMEVNQGVLIGAVNDKAKEMISSINLTEGSGGESKLQVVTRNPPGTEFSVSFSCDENGAVIGDASVGDSSIQICNKRFVVDHELSLANKTWRFAKDMLGVTGKRSDEDHTERIRLLEARDQRAKGRKGKNNGSQ